MMTLDEAKAKLQQLKAEEEAAYRLYAAKKNEIEPLAAEWMNKVKEVQRTQIIIEIKEQEAA